ncbi:MAG TPA: CRTAC1 family protein [Candidatus Polarisedimenticolia bacterium]|nr:CRTAC1 family protein [Candidatus Polarisedimenticolia bacterium]
MKFLTLLPWVVVLAAAPTACSPSSRQAPSPAPGARSEIRETPPASRGSGTRKMAALLERLAAESSPEENHYLSDRRAEVLRARLALATNPKERIDLASRFARELLNAGKSEEALRQFRELERLAREQSPGISPENRALLRLNMALANLRLGEQENCLAHHTTESCLLPIRPAGVHRIQRGSRAAITLLTEQLAEFPDDLKSRWLINIAYMTVGEYPDKVPKRWLIPPSAFRSEAEVKRFRDIAPRLGLDVDDLAGGVIADDFDGDGYLDLMVSTCALRGQLRYFHNNADGTFSERTREAGLVGEVGGLNLLHADYNNDGHPDVLVLRGGWLEKAGHFPPSLLRNDGDGTFEDVTEEAGLLSLHPSQTAVWLDYNGDGFIDLFLGVETSDEEKQPCRLYRNNRDGTFTDVAASAGVAHVGFVKAVASGDFNNDGRPDLYLSQRTDPNILFRNDGPRGPDTSLRGDWRFTDVSLQAGVVEPVFSFPAFFFDYDNDGWEDLYVGGYYIDDVGDIAADYLGLPGKGKTPRLYHNSHDGTLADVTRQARLDRVLHAMAANFGDIDNDGWLDLYLGTGDPSLATIIPNRMLRNAEGRFFQDVTSSAGVGHLQKGHGIAFADLDNDGDQDLYEVMGGILSGDDYRNVLYENPGFGNHWLTLNLEGVTSNRAAIGARIRTVVRTADGERSIYKTVRSGGSFGASPLRQEIGLGQARSVERVEILWPASGEHQVLRGLEMDHFYRVREGESQAMPVSLKSFRLSPGEAQVSR